MTSEQTWLASTPLPDLDVRAAVHVSFSRKQKAVQWRRLHSWPAQARFGAFWLHGGEPGQALGRVISLEVTGSPTGAHTLTAGMGEGVPCGGGLTKVQPP